MARYNCPYCSPCHQIHKQRSDGVMICGHCGDPLVKVQAIRPTQIMALVAASAFIAPLIIMVVTYLRNLNHPQPQKFMQAIIVLLNNDN